MTSSVQGSLSKVQARVTWRAESRHLEAIGSIAAMGTMYVSRAVDTRRSIDAVLVMALSWG